MNKTSKFTIKTRLSIILGIMIIGFTLFGVAMLHAMSTLNVNGPIYKRIVQGKDLVADILPPPEYILESYLVVLQLTHSTNPDEISTLVKRFDVLKGEYDTRHTYWENETLETELKKPLLEKSYYAAKAFYSEAQQTFIPSVQAKNHDVMMASLDKMRVSYEQHRSAIDEVVQETNKRNMKDELHAKSLIGTYDLGLLTIFVFSIVLSTIVMWWISRGILSALKSAQKIANAIAVGDLSLPIDTQQVDEIGDLLRSMDKMQRALTLFVKAQDEMAIKHAQGYTKEKLDVSQFLGTYNRIAQQMNELIQSRVTLNRRIIEIVSQYAKGAFPLIWKNYLAKHTLLQLQCVTLSKHCF
jgi:methyl-accepting chemotaxis protein